MEQPNYKPNSNKYKSSLKANDNKKKIEKVIKGGIISKKKNHSIVDKIASTFIQENPENIKSYVLMDVLVPAVKKAISDIVTNGVHMVLYGEVKPDNSSGSKYRSYNKMYNSGESGSERKSSSNIYDFNDITLETRGDAEEVLNNLIDIVDHYGMASVADFYDLVGIDSSYTDNNWGWMDLRTASTIRDKDGYKVKLPKAVPLN